MLAATTEILFDEESPHWDRAQKGLGTMRAISAEEAQSVGPQAAPGWYPDPDQVETQRYWDGNEWTDQRAPLQRVGGVSLSAPLLLAILGAAAAALGVFLPRVDAASSLHIADNSVIAEDLVVGILVLGAAVGSVRSVYQDQTRTTRNLWLELAGLLVIAAAIYYGTGDRLDLRTTDPSGFIGSIAIDGSPGVGLYVMGIGGALLMLAGYLVPAKSSTRPSS